MKKLLLLCLILSACQKEAIKPSFPKISLNDIPNNEINIGLYKGSFLWDATLIEFREHANPNYDDNEDAVYFPGWGIVSMWTLSADSIPCAINVTPLKTIVLVVNGQPGAYILKLRSCTLPKNTVILCNGFDLRKESYHFTMNGEKEMFDLRVE